jgi:threonine/homoserine/homoserine lactone efflux protein
MSIELWSAFVLASVVILVIPGPTILLVVSQAVAHGGRSVLPLAAGVVAGDFTAMTLSLMGLGAVLATSAALFSVLKWIGAVYLFFLGIRLWRTRPQDDTPSAIARSASGKTLFTSAFWVTALNPKSIAFFVAFLPQFVSLQAPSIGQLVILETTFVTLAGLNAAVYAIFAGRLRDQMQSLKVRRWFNRCGGGALIGAGALTAAIEQSA